MPISIEQAWAFFSSPLNLKKITPKEMKLVVTSDFTEDTAIYEGMLITYKVSPLPGIQMNWMTEITHVRDGKYFVDEQRFGPYALWHHEHHFKEIEGGVLMNDVLYYAIPYGFVGTIANQLFVGKKVKQIFEYREQAIKQLFGEIK